MLVKGATETYSNEIAAKMIMYNSRPLLEFCDIALTTTLYTYNGHPFEYLTWKLHVYNAVWKQSF